MKNRLIAGLFSIALILLVVIGPLWLAEKLEAIETASGELVPYQEIISSNVTYEPYHQFNENNPGMAPGHYTASVYQSGSYEMTTLVYDVDGTKDLTGWNGTGSATFYYVFDVDIEQMIEDEANILYFEFNTTCHYALEEIRAITVDADRVLLGYDTTSYIGTLFPPGIVGTYISGGLTSSDAEIPISYLISWLANGTTLDENAEYILRFKMTMFSYNMQTVISDFQITPGYYEITTNEYGDVFVPYIQTFTTYAVHKVGMVIGAVLIAVGSVIASPLPIGERFDSVFPVSNFTRKRTKRRKN